MNFEGSNIIYAGNQSIVQSRKSVILNSRQSKTPVGNDSWVQKTLQSVRSAVERDYAIISSIGMNTWELSLWATNEYGGKGVVFLPVEKKEVEAVSVEKLINDFELVPENFAFLLIKPEIETRSSKGWWDSRDKIVFDIADMVMPVSVREKGRWSQFLESADLKNIDNSFRIRYSQKSKGRGLEIKIPNEITHVENWDYLTHWTRRFHEPWSGEKSSDFYRAIVSSGFEYPRTASATLKRIISEKLLRGAGTKIRKGIPVVAFTSLAPSDAVNLMRWRSRYVRYTFEPYGVAIKREAAISLGARQVEYISNRMKIHGEDSAFIQGYSKGDWPREAEWRFVGDLDLKRLDESDMKILIPHSDELDEFQSVSSNEVVSLDSLR